MSDQLQPQADGQPIRVRVEIDGDLLTIRGTSTASHVKEMASIVNERIAEVRKAHPNIPRHQAVILVAMGLADELHRKGAEYSELLDLLEQAR